MTDILIVDAISAFRSELRIALERHPGFLVVAETADPREAVELVRSYRPELVIVDLDIPRLAGTDLITQIRTDVEGVRIVVSSRLGRHAASPAAEGVERVDVEVARLIALVAEVESQRSPTVVIDLPNEPASVARARRFVESWCRAWGALAVLDPALLVVSELVTNAITHGGGLYELRLRLTGEALRIEVVDGGAGSPEIAQVSETDEGGRGLRIVTLSSRAWGVTSGENGTKIIWAEIPARPGG